MHLEQQCDLRRLCFGLLAYGACWFFYGFVGAALAWQIAFFFIATEPSRFRPLMIPSVLEKLSYSAAVVLLVLQGRMHASDLVFGGTDLLLGVLFAIAYFKTPPRIA